MKTFEIKYDGKLSSIAKVLLNSLQNKYLYYAIDDILYSLKDQTVERNNLLTILYSPVLSLQNNFYIDFLEIWIYEISIMDGEKKNKFLMNMGQNYEPVSYITITFLYNIPSPIEPKKVLW